MVAVDYSIMSEQVDKQKVAYRFLKQWKNPSEIAKESDLDRGEVLQHLEDEDIEATPDKGRERQVRFRKSAKEPSYLTEDIDGKYIAEDEVPSLEDYADGLANKLATYQIAEVVNSYYGDGTVTEEEINGYLDQRDGAKRIGPHNYEVRPYDDDDLMRVRGLRDVLRQYHDDLDEKMDELREESLR